MSTTDTQAETEPKLSTSATAEQNVQPDRPGQNAQQSIAQSTAIAMADATDNLRNLNTLSTTAIGVALSNYIETGDDKHVKVIHEAQNVVTTGTTNFESVSQKVAQLFKGN